MTRLSILADKHRHRECHKALATSLDRPDIAGLFDDAGLDRAASVRQALEAYAVAASRDAAIRLAGEFITSALKGKSP